MLKALEIHGFKSFADKTRFEFPPGITVVVGPNGSGKSNVVDAIRWVLGEQSVKSMRGQEMADVIFKGNGEGGRKPMNTAEVTMVLDNTERLLPIDVPEVHVTRRLFRGGEGEYLINRQPVRLKDVRDLFRGTGVATDGYSLIEQGKVDRMLQSSAKERRAMFEEAAGISRFKVKKIEALRRLERVDQNLLRLRDIVDEVDNRLRSVRAQAGKARRYREYSERLRELRTLAAAVAWKQLSSEMGEVDKELTVCDDRLQATNETLEAAEIALIELEQQQNEHNETLRRDEQRWGNLRDQALRRDDHAEELLTRQAALHDEKIRRGQQIATLCIRVHDAQSRSHELNQRLQAAELECDRLNKEVMMCEATAMASTRRFDELRTQAQALHRQYIEHVKHAAALGNEAGTLVTRQESLAAALSEFEQQRHSLQQAIHTNATLQREHQERLKENIAAEEAKRKEREEADVDLDKKRLVLSERQEDLAHVRGRHRGAIERSQLLESWERRREGVGAGVKKLLEVSAEGNTPFSALRGVLADHIKIDAKWAPYLELALGTFDQAILVAGNTATIDELTAHCRDLAGPVSLILADMESKTAVLPSLENEPGVIACLADLVETASEYRPLANRLLANVWLASTLADARRLQTLVPSGRFITLDRQLLEPNGSLTIASESTAVGLVSRKSELRTLRNDIPVFERQIADAQAEIALLKENITALELHSRQLADVHHAVAARVSESRSAIAKEQREGDELASRLASLEKQHASMTNDVDEAKTRLAQVRASQAEHERRTSAIESQQQEFELQTRAADQTRREAQQALTIAQIEFARSEQLRDAVRFQSEQCIEDEHQRQRLLFEEETLIGECNQRSVSLELQILRAEQESASFRSQQATAALDVQQRIDLVHALSQQRINLQSDCQQLRRTSRELETLRGAARLRKGELSQRREGIATRLTEDYGIESATLTDFSLEGVAFDPIPAEDEMTALRRKINAIGAVNLDALDELDELEVRHKSLNEQYTDLSDAKQSLEKVIHRIDNDSRRLFVETLEAVRLNFQTLYRRAFGGGKADLVLEEGVDVLESGVEIMATPPGKSSFSNSLLSGGERALTAVALLLAIFQFRPSPFCVLDEVDAPFDEANIGRFIDVLKEFLSTTRFIIVTHSKRTMTAANTLYGVTMQESGVSKRVSVRFEDVSDDGRISSEAVRREEARENEERDAESGHGGGANRTVA